MTTNNSNSAKVGNKAVYTSWNKKPFVKQSCSFESLMERANNAGYKVQMTCRHRTEFLLTKVTKVGDIPLYNTYDTVIISLVSKEEEESFKKNNIYGVKEN